MANHLAVYKTRSDKVHASKEQMRRGPSVSQKSPPYYRSVCGRIGLLGDLKGKMFEHYPSDQKCKHCQQLLIDERRKIVGAPSTEEERIERRIRAGMIYVPGRVNKNPWTGERI
jgi:hypothetical protein